MLCMYNLWKAVLLDYAHMLMRLHRFLLDFLKHILKPCSSWNNSFVRIRSSHFSFETFFFVDYFFIPFLYQKWKCRNALDNILHEDVRTWCRNSIEAGAACMLWPDAEPADVANSGWTRDHFLHDFCSRECNCKTMMKNLWKLGNGNGIRPFLHVVSVASIRRKSP